MAIFQSRPHTVEAVQITSTKDSMITVAGFSHFSEEPNWLLEALSSGQLYLCDDNLYVTGRMEGDVGSWVVYDPNTHWLGILSKKEFTRNYETV